MVVLSISATFCLFSLSFNLQPNPVLKVAHIRIMLQTHSSTDRMMAIITKVKKKNATKLRIWIDTRRHGWMDEKH